VCGFFRVFRLCYSGALFLCLWCKILVCVFVYIINSPKFDLPIIETTAQSRGKMMLTCHRCNEVGHKAIACPRLSGGASVSASDNFTVATSAAQHSNRSYYSGFRHDLRPLDQVTCFKVSVCYLINQKYAVITIIWIIVHFNIRIFIEYHVTEFILQWFQWLCDNESCN